MCAWGGFTILLPGFICLIHMIGPGFCGFICRRGQQFCRPGWCPNTLILSAFSAYEMGLSSTSEPLNHTKLPITMQSLPWCWIFLLSYEAHYIMASWLSKSKMKDVEAQSLGLVILLCGGAREQSHSLGSFHSGPSCLHLLFLASLSLKSHKTII